MKILSTPSLIVPSLDPGARARILEAAGSPRRAGRVIATFCENLQRLRDGRPLLALIDNRKGY